MKNSNFISESVFETNLKYVQMQNKTKELFFRCLDEGRDVEYFEQQMKKLWGSLDYSYLMKSVEEYEALMHEINTGEKIEPEEVKKLNIIPVLSLVALSVIKNTDDKFQNVKKREYETSLKSYGYTTAKDEYLKLKVKKYTNDVVPYYSKETGKIIRYVKPSTYNSMIHNTNLTRSGWNTTLRDGDITGQGMYYIPGHSFSCPECVGYQNKPMTKKQVERLIGDADEGEDELLHPNCKCVLTFYEGQKLTKINKEEAEEQYHIRQKVNTLTLKKEEIWTDMKIQKGLGNEDEYDKLNQQRNRINKEIRGLKEALPTDELKKQVVAINR